MKLSMPKPEFKMPERDPYQPRIGFGLIYGVKVVIPDVHAIITDAPVFDTPVASSVEWVEAFHRKVLNVPVVCVRDMTKARHVTTLLAHRKTHKRIKKFLVTWKPVHVEIYLQHAPWKKLIKENKL